MANAPALGSSAPGVGSIVNTARILLELAPGDDTGASIGSQAVPFIARVSASMMSIFNPLFEVNTFTGTQEAAFRAFAGKFRSTVASIFGTSDVAKLRLIMDDDAMVDKVVDGNLVRQWGFDLMNAARTADGLTAHVEEPILPTLPELGKWLALGAGALIVLFIAVET